MDQSNSKERVCKHLLFSISYSTGKGAVWAPVMLSAAGPFLNKEELLGLCLDTSEKNKRFLLLLFEGF